MLTSERPEYGGDIDLSRCKRPIETQEVVITIITISMLLS